MHIKTLLASAVALSALAASPTLAFEQKAGAKQSQKKVLAPPTIDTNGDGKADAWDRDKNGKADAWDVNNDGKPDLFDDDGDGRPDPKSKTKRP